MEIQNERKEIQDVSWQDGRKKKLEQMEYEKQFCYVVSRQQMFTVVERKTLVSRIKMINK